MQNQEKNRVILVSIPKAGTYLAAQMLARLGLDDSHLHLRYDERGIGIYDFRNAPVKMSMSDQEERFRPMPLAEALAMVRSGEFVLGHLPPIPEVKQQLYTDFRIVFLVRDLRDCLISHMRYMINVGVITLVDHPWCTIPDEKERFKQYLLKYAEEVGPLVNMKLIACWEYDLHNPYPGMEIFKLRFEDLVSADKVLMRTTIRSLAKFLQMEERHDIDEMIQSVIGAETLTKSGEQTVRERYWTPFAEKWFEERIADAQGNNINKMIGYK